MLAGDRPLVVRTSRGLYRRAWALDQINMIMGVLTGGTLNSAGLASYHRRKNPQDRKYTRVGSNTRHKNFTVTLLRAVHERRSYNLWAVMLMGCSFELVCSIGEYRGFAGVPREHTLEERGGQ